MGKSKGPWSRPEERPSSIVGWSCHPVDSNKSVSRGAVRRVKEDKTYATLAREQPLRDRRRLVSVALSGPSLAVRSTLRQGPQLLDLVLLLRATQVGRRTVRLRDALAARHDRAAAAARRDRARAARPPLLGRLPRTVALDVHAVLVVVLRAKDGLLAVLVHLVVVVGAALPADEPARLGEHRRALLERRRVVPRLFQHRRHLRERPLLVLARHHRAVLLLVLLLVLEPEQRLLVPDRRSGSPDRLLFRVDLRLRVVEAGRLEAFLLGLELVELGDNVWVDKVGNVLAVLDLRDDVVLPLVVLQLVVLCDT